MINSMSINSLMLMGRLCADPELRQTQSGVPVCRFKVAVNRQKDSNGEQKADFIGCTAWRTTAEFVSKYFKKGSMIIVDGSVHNNDYTDNNGVKHYNMDVQVNSVGFGESKNASDTHQNAPQSTQGGYGYNDMQNHNGRITQASSVVEKANNLGIGNIDDYESILSDGDVPF